MLAILHRRSTKFSLLRVLLVKLVQKETYFYETIRFSELRVETGCVGKLKIFKWTFKKISSKNIFSSWRKFSLKKIFRKIVDDFFEKIWKLSLKIFKMSMQIFIENFQNVNENFHCKFSNVNENFSIFQWTFSDFLENFSNIENFPK